MPYFQNKNINLLLIHIPKTGGTSLERYFSKKFNIKLDNKSLYMYLPKNLKEKFKINTSLQHISYSTIFEYKNKLNVCFDNIKIITIVRNPYERLVSDLCHFKKLNIDTSQEEVFNIIENYITDTNLDNHNLPQYTFITNKDKILIPNIHILHTETLKEDMINLEYTDFNEHIKTKSNINTDEINYYDFLNNKSIQLINDFYDYDFRLFNYTKIVI
jgi:hypothetical protein